MPPQSRVQPFPGLSAFIAAELKRRGWDQGRLANEAKLSRSGMSASVHKEQLTPDAAGRIARALGLTLDELRDRAAREASAGASRALTSLAVSASTDVVGAVGSLSRVLGELAAEVRFARQLHDQEVAEAQSRQAALSLRLRSLEQNVDQVSALTARLFSVSITTMQAVNDADDAESERRIADAAALQAAREADARLVQDGDEDAAAQA